MLDKGEYLGNFVICKENSTMNDDFSWTVYQNDKVRSLLNRSIALGKRLFCKIDQVGVHGAYTPRVRDLSTIRFIPDDEVAMGTTRIWFGCAISSRMYQPGTSSPGSGWIAGQNEWLTVAGTKYIKEKKPFTTTFLNIVDVMQFSQIELAYRSLTNIIEFLNLSYKNLLHFQTFTDETQIQWLEMYLCPWSYDWTRVDTNAQSLWFAIEWNCNYSKTDFHLIDKLLQFKPCKATKGFMISELKQIEENDYTTKNLLVKLPIQKWSINIGGHYENINLVDVYQSPIDDGVVYWYHPDLTFNNLNMNPITGMLQNDKIVSYADGEGPTYEIMQLSSQPHIKFFHYDSNLNGEREYVTACVPDFHIVLSFYTSRTDFIYDEMKYLGNFVISLENTTVDRHNNTIQCYQNDKVRNMLDRVNKKGKKLYAKVDQINFETAVRSNYSIVIEEYRIHTDALIKGDPSTQSQTYARNFVVSDLQGDIKEFWNTITDMINSADPTATKNHYSFVYSETTGLVITVRGRGWSGGVLGMGSEPIGVWRICFNADLCEDFHLPKSIEYRDDDIWIPITRYRQSNYVHVETSEIKDGGTYDGCYQDIITFASPSGRDATFNSNQMYFYHPDLVGDNCNLEPLTIACQYPGTNHYNQHQYYYVRSLSAPTYIRFFHWVATEQRINVTVDNKKETRSNWSYHKEDYVPANFNVVISYYEGD